MKRFTSKDGNRRPCSYSPLSKLAGATLLALTLYLPPTTTFAAQPALMLANLYRSDIALDQYWVSEKYDGVRGYWDGEKLFTRGGEAVNAPAWFTAALPKTPLDGELWVGHGQFAAAVSIVRQKTPDDDAWRTMHFMVFDLPAHSGTFTERDAQLHKVVEQIGQPWVRHVVQSKLADKAALQALLKKTVRQGGEGLMLHRGDSHYKGVRNDDLLKLKMFDDAEATVTAHIPGKGKYAGMLGALEVTTPEGLKFRLGSGLSDQERRNPPALGSLVSYRFNGVNEKTGIARFARFWRIRSDLMPQ